MTGKKITKDDQTFYQSGYYTDGLEYGFIFKDEDAFNNHPDQVCYIPEYTFEDADVIEIEGETYSIVDGYTRNDLELMIKDEIDDDGDPIDIECFFNSLKWAHPETYLAELI